GRMDPSGQSPNRMLPSSRCWRQAPRRSELSAGNCGIHDGEVGEPFVLVLSQSAISRRAAVGTPEASSRTARRRDCHVRPIRRVFLTAIPLDASDSGRTYYGTEPSACEAFRLVVERFAQQRAASVLGCLHLVPLRGYLYDRRRIV